MKHHAYLVLIIFIIFVPQVSAQSSDGECALDALKNTLLEIQAAHEAKDLLEAMDLLDEAIEIVDFINENCLIETPDAGQAEETSIVEPSSELEKPKENGFYLVGIDIAAGHWESTGTNDDCYWARTDVEGETIANHFGLAGGTMTILETDFQVELNDCGTWVYVENREVTLLADATESKENGFYTVNVEIAPGLWRSTGSGNDCYYARLDEYQETIDNHFGNAGVTINIQPTDYEVEFNDCGRWEYLGEP